MTFRTYCQYAWCATLFTTSGFFKCANFWPTARALTHTHTSPLWIRFDATHWVLPTWLKNRSLASKPNNGKRTFNVVHSSWDPFRHCFYFNSCILCISRVVFDARARVYFVLSAMIKHMPPSHIHYQHQHINARKYTLTSTDLEGST